MKENGLTSPNDPEDARRPAKGSEALEPQNRVPRGTEVPKAQFRLTVLSLVVALASVLVTGWLQWENQRLQEDLKHYEVSFPLRQESYAAFMRTFYEAFDTAYTGNTMTIHLSVYELETQFFTLEPFLSDDDRASLWDQLLQYEGMLLKLAADRDRAKGALDGYFESYVWYRNAFRRQLYGSLFEGTDGEGA